MEENQSYAIDKPFFPSLIPLLGESFPYPYWLSEDIGYCMLYKRLYKTELFLMTQWSTYLYRTAHAKYDSVSSKQAEEMQADTESWIFSGHWANWVSLLWFPDQSPYRTEGRHAGAVLGGTPLTRQKCELNNHCCRGARDQHAAGVCKCFHYSPGKLWKDCS